MPHREVQDNTMKTIKPIHLLSYARKENIPLCFCFVEKVFNKVDLDFLRMGLMQIGLQKSLMSKIITLYTLFSTKQLAIPKLLHCQWHSPMLSVFTYFYIFTMEHLAIKLKTNPSIQGLQIGMSEYKLALNVLLLYVSALVISRIPILCEFETFCALSNLNHFSPGRYYPLNIQ